MEYFILFLPLIAAIISGFFSKFIGEKVLEHLKEMNEVAYLRYASVYKEFSDASDFEKEVAEFN